MTYTLVRSHNRYRSASLQVKPTGEVVVRAPRFMPRFMIDRFVQSHTPWIEKRIKELTTPRPPLTKHFEDDAHLISFIKAKVAEYQAKMHLHPETLVFKRVRSYWGSCAPSGRISFNLALIYTPPSAVEYVVVHELAHLKYRGHGQRFWNYVERYYPQAKQIKKRYLTRTIAVGSNLPGPTL